MAKIVDWDYWRHQFITGDMSLKELSEGHSAPAFKTLRNRSSAEDWPSQRKKFRDMQRTQAVTVPDVRQTVEEVKRIIDTAEMLTRHIGAARILGKKAVQAIQMTDPAKLKPSDAMAWLKLAVEVERLTEGLATQRQEIDLSTLSDAELEKLAKGDG